jgi:phosphomannomutase
MSSSGLRGIVGEDLTPTVIDHFVRSFLKWCPKGDIILGGDPRTSHDGFIRLISAIGMLCGRSIIYIGQVPTPTVQQMVRYYNAAGGLAVTASHNPIQWNGIKLINASGSFLSQAEYQAFSLLHENNEMSTLMDWNNQGGFIVDNLAIDRHIEIINKILLFEKIKPLRVLVDVNHGAACVADQKLFSKLPQVHVDFIYNAPDGRFSHEPEPLKENLTLLCEKMKKGNYDIGFAQDPDADRLVIIDENGQFIGEDYSLAFCMDIYLELFKQANNVAVVNLSTSKIIDHIAKKHGTHLIKTKIGEPNVTAVMKEKNAIIGGEGNGGIICPAIGWGRDSLTGIVLALTHLSHASKTVSEIINKYPSYTLVREKLPLSSPTMVAEKLKKVANHYVAHNINYDDGIKVEFESSWVHIRASNTEPIIRIFAEAKTKEKALKLIDEINNL